MKNQRVYIKGKEISDIGGISLKGIFYGDGVFETMRWKGSCPVCLKKHIKRILHGASVLQIPEPDGEKITEEIFEAVQKSEFQDCAVKLCVVAGGSCTPFFAEPDSFQTIISVTEISEQLLKQNLKIICSGMEYSRNYSPLSGIKSLNYLENVLAMRAAKKRHFDDTLFLTPDGFVTETTCRNIFWGKDGDIFTPPLGCGILPGITRETLIEIASENGFAVSQRLFRPEDMMQADFVFATNSLEGMTLVEKLKIQDMTLTFSTSVQNSYKILKSLLYQYFKWV